MPTSASSRLPNRSGFPTRPTTRRRHGAARRAAGFSLLELLLVMVLIGLASALVLPDFWRWTRSIGARTELNLVVAEIEGLGFRAWSSGRALTLDAGGAHRLLRSLPREWQLEPAPPIRYAPIGTCSGGSLVLVDPDGARYPLRLAPLTCDVERG